MQAIVDRLKAKHQLFEELKEALCLECDGGGGGGGGSSSTACAIASAWAAEASSEVDRAADAMLQARREVEKACKYLGQAVGEGDAEGAALLHLAAFLRDVEVEVQRWLRMNRGGHATATKARDVQQQVSNAQVSSQMRSNAVLKAHSSSSASLSVTASPASVSSSPPHETKSQHIVHNAQSDTHEQQRDNQDHPPSPQPHQQQLTFASHDDFTFTSPPPPLPLPSCSSIASPVCSFMSPPPHFLLPLCPRAE
jgi:hypothetical protein